MGSAYTKRVLRVLIIVIISPISNIYFARGSPIFLHEELQVPVDLRVGGEPDPVPGRHGHQVLVKSLPSSRGDVGSVVILRNPGSHARISVKKAKM